MRRSSTRIPGLVVAALVAAAGLVGLTPSGASAALCSGGGVNVVVDHHGLGGGVSRSCDPSGSGRTADQVFPAAGFSLTYAQRQPGFVCRINGTPSNDPCVNTSPSDAYWGLYWSDGTSGKWNYSSAGVGGLKVPSGGFVAFSWQNGGAADPPGVAPVGAKPTPKPTPRPTPRPTPTPTPRPTRTPHPTAIATASSTGTASAKATKSTRTASASPSGSASASASTSASAGDSASPSSETLAPLPSDSPSSDAVQAPTTKLAAATPQNDGGLPLWVPGAVIVLLAAGTGGALWWRRRAGAA